MYTYIICGGMHFGGMYTGLVYKLNYSLITLLHIWPPYILIISRPWSASVLFPRWLYFIMYMHSYILYHIIHEAMSAYNIYLCVWLTLTKKYVNI